MMIIDNIDYTFEEGKHKGKKFKEVVRRNKKNVLKLIKEGYIISDDILKLFNIKKEIKSVKVTCDTVFDKSNNSSISAKEAARAENDESEDESESEGETDKEFILMGTLIDEIDIN